MTLTHTVNTKFSAIIKKLIIYSLYKNHILSNKFKQ